MRSRHPNAFLYSSLVAATLEGKEAPRNQPFARSNPRGAEPHSLTLIIVYSPNFRPLTHRLASGMFLGRHLHKPLRLSRTPLAQRTWPPPRVDHHPTLPWGVCVDLRINNSFLPDGGKGQLIAASHAISGPGNSAQPQGQAVRAHTHARPDVGQSKGKLAGTGGCKNLSPRKDLTAQ